MSWFTTANIVGSEIEITGQTFDDHPSEVQDQFMAAIAAVMNVFSSGAVGGPGHAYSVTIGGHANPNHEPATGWANDGLTFSISQLSDDPPAE